MERRKFTREFKLEAVRLSIKLGAGQRSLSRAGDAIITPPALFAWLSATGTLGLHPPRPASQPGPATPAALTLVSRPNLN
jgi:transposase-like protein